MSYCKWLGLGLGLGRYKNSSHYLQCSIPPAVLPDTVVCQAFAIDSLLAMYICRQAEPDLVLHNYT